MNRNEILAELKQLGYTGPVSYTKPKLLEILGQHRHTPITREGLESLYRDAMNDRPTGGCTIDGPHCENCGSTDYEDVNLGDQGYTACCNELVSYGTQDCRNHHSF